MNIALWILVIATIVHVLCRINKRSKLMIVAIGYWLSIFVGGAAIVAVAVIFLINNIAIV